VLPLAIGLSTIFLLSILSCTPSIVEDRVEQNETIPELISVPKQEVFESISPFSQNRKTNETKNIKLLEEFDKPLNFFPLVEMSMTKYGSDGLLYREGISDPFSGRLVERNSLGVKTLEASFLDGSPHGQQLRRHEDGTLSLEAIFDSGVLTGVKTSWWKNGNIREEEYWDNGKYRGRKIWDEHGRLVKEERMR